MADSNWQGPKVTAATVKAGKCPNCDRPNRGAVTVDLGYGWCCSSCEVAAEAGKPAEHTETCDAREAGSNG